MGCCVVLMAVIAHFFAWRRRIRRALGLTVEDWDETESEPRFAEVWRGRFDQVTRSMAGRAVLASLVMAELVFASVALPGPNGLIAAHREHFRQVVSYVGSLGRRAAPAAYCGVPVAAPESPLVKPAG